MSNIGKALGSFPGFRGAQVPKDPTTEAEFTALVNAVDGGSIWSGDAPTWAQVEAKVAELDAADSAAANQKLTDKTNGNQKLLDLGLTQAEVDAITGQ